MTVEQTAQIATEQSHTSAGLRREDRYTTAKPVGLADRLSWREDIAFVFPGQGSQSVGMLDDIDDTDRVVRDTFAMAADVLGFDLWTLIAEGPAEALSLTSNTQPAMLCAGVALWRLWLDRGGARPGLMAGHSLGEYTALTCAEAIAFEDALNLVATRARLMQEAVAPGEGAMAAIIGLDGEQIEPICEQAAQGQIVAPANYNSPDQIVVAGHAEAVQRAIELAKKAGARRAIPLVVSGPFHCALMQPAAERLREHLEALPIRRPQVPVIHNADVAAHSDCDAIRRALIRQLSMPVRWSDTIAEMANRGVQTVVECGPGKVLAALNRRITRGLHSLSLWDNRSIQAGLQALGGARSA